ncbi:MAG: hypothetical protein ACI8ZF_000940 [Candidatus Midichloriaceae bacterium]|jgi:hypothetical protein
MAVKLELFSLNRGLGEDAFTKNSHIQEPILKNNIETNVFLDTNIISNIRKFTLKEPSLNAHVYTIVEQVIEIFKKVPNIYISPGLALYECCDDLRNKNITAFNIFLENYLPRCNDAYNSTDANIAMKKEGEYYLLNTWASIFAIQYITKHYSDLKPEDKFNKFMDLINEHLCVIDGIICALAQYAFACRDGLTENHKKIVKNFIKKGDMKKQSLNATYDIIFIRVISMSYNRKSPSFNNKMESWGLTADQGLREYSKLISFSKDTGPFISLDIGGLDKIQDYLESCQSKCYKIGLQRLSSVNIQNNITNGDKIISNAKILMAKLENEKI